MARRRSCAERQLRAEARRFFRSIRGLLLLQVLPLTAGVCVVLALLPSPTWWTSFIQGAFLTSMLAIVGFAFLLNGDGALLYAGALGEGHTNEQLDRAVKAGHIWSYAPNVEANRHDVDHLVLAPGGILALETKWRFRGADQAWLRKVAADAREAERRARLVLMSKGIEYRTEAIPAVVVWGGARRELPDMQQVDGLAVVRGDMLLGWLAQFNHGYLSADLAEQLHTKLTTFIANQRPAA